MNTPLAKQLRLDLNTGEIKEVTAAVSTVKQYFASLNRLNKASHIYGVVYLATDEALNELNTTLVS